MSKNQTTLEEEEGPEEVCIIDTLVEEHYNQNMQDKLNESLGDLEERLSKPPDVLATLQGCQALYGKIIQSKPQVRDANFIWDPDNLNQDQIF